MAEQVDKIELPLLLTKEVVIPIIFVYYHVFVDSREVGQSAKSHKGTIESSSWLSHICRYYQ